MRRMLLPLLLALPATASAESLLELCVESPRRDAEAAQRLDAWMTTARVELHTGACSGGGYVGRFVKDARGVVFVLSTPAGGRLERRVPWLAAVDAPLDRLSAAGRLSEFSVLVEALLAEDRLGLFDEPSPPPPPKPAPKPAPKTKPKPKVAAKPGPPPVVALEPATAPAPVGPEVVATPAPDPVPEPAPPAPAPPPAPVVAQKPKPPPVVIPPLPEAPPFWDGWALQADALAGMRWRSPGVLAPEAGIGFRFGPLLARGSWQAVSRWDLEGRPLDVGALSLSAGVALPLATSSQGSLHLLVAGVAERLEVREVYAGATDFGGWWDAGPAAGLGADFALGAGLGLGIGAEVQWMPTARRVLIPPSGWPSGTLNALSVRGAVVLSYGE